MDETIPEAQLQAYVLGLVRKALPHVPPAGFSVEKRLKLRMGRSRQDEDGTRHWKADGRADLVVSHGGRPLAVFELKRHDQVLDEDDVDQARSYALVMLGQPPLVIVSNGGDTWIRLAADGTALDPDAEGAAFVEKLFANVGRLAAANVAWAVETLMGPETQVWVEAVRLRTDELVERLTGDPQDPRAPFVKDPPFRRRATHRLRRLLEGGAKAVVLEGAPLAGKSNVLRELAADCRESPDWAMLMVNAATHGPGLFRRLANTLGDALEWTLSTDDVRTWLRRMSRSGRRPALVLAVDGVAPGSDVAADLEELAESGLGDGLRLLVTADRADDALRDGRGRGASALAGIARVVEVTRLDDEEFQLVREALGDQRILFHGGAELSPEYRSPWILRSVLAGGRAPDDEEQAAVIPGTMGLKTIRVARQRLATLGAVARNHRLIARDVLADEASPAPELALVQSGAYVFCRDSLGPSAESAATALEADGWARFDRHRNGGDVVIMRAPEFIMGELAAALADQLADIVDGDAEEAAAQLVWQSQRFFLGDLVGAQAVVDLAARRGSLPAALIEPLMNDPPVAEALEGKLIGVPMPNGDIMNLRFDGSGGVARADADGNPVEPFEPFGDPGDAPTMHGNTAAWMILSQLARLPSVMGAGGDRLDLEIILHVGQCREPLVRGGVSPSLPHAIQNLGPAGAVLALPHALAEPMTAAIHRLLADEWRTLGPFLDAAVATGSLTLAVRLHHALASLRGSVDPETAAFAETTLRDIVNPLVRRLMAASAPDAG